MSEETNKEFIKEVVDALLQQYTFKTMIDDESMYVYTNNGTYIKGDPTLKMICANMDKMRTNGKHNQLKLNIQGRTFCDRNDFITPEGFINLKNGVLNINNLEFDNTIPNDAMPELLMKSPEYNFQEEIPIQYNPNAKCPMFMKFLNEVIENKKDIRILQKWFGYHMKHDNKHKKAVILLGAKHSGKSLTMEILEALMGVNNFSHFELCDFDNVHSHSIPSLYGKIGNTYADMSMKLLLDIGKFKILTGNDNISTRQHFKEPFNFKNYAKLTFSTNKCALVGDAVSEDEAFWDRLIIVRYNKPSYGIPDKELAKKIISNEISGVLNWALEGYKMAELEGFPEYKLEETKKIWADSMMGSAVEIMGKIEHKITISENGIIQF